MRHAPREMSIRNIEVRFVRMINMLESHLRLTQHQLLTLILDGIFQYILKQSFGAYCLLLACRRPRRQCAIISSAMFKSSLVSE
jgi:hypothetical protein